MKCVFYALGPGETSADSPPSELPEGYESKLWRPRLACLLPPGCRTLGFVLRTLLHYLHIFRNRHYAVCLISWEGEVAHRSCVYPGYTRYPFMSPEDLQVGDTWTAEEHRGKGLATCALQEIVHRFADGRRRLWYLAYETNVPSVRVAEKAGFRLRGTGVRTKRLGLGFLGQYVITDPQ
jgi:GNAT superfamily N-acetyltransferase